MRSEIKITALFLLILPILLLASCKVGDDQGIAEGAHVATEHGVLPENSGEENSRNLQKLIDSLTSTGGVVYIPEGEYAFAANGTQTIGSHCIKMRSNVSIVGAGEETVLLPEGESKYGLDMFYFNDYLDTGKDAYLENCRFEDFVIDAKATSCETYTSAGKGFMFNLFRDCHWEGVTVKNTDATGFGVDCPIDSSIKNCIAIGCGKAANEENGGASGFGIGFGYSDGESLTISDCTASDNKKFGFFFEHQGRFNSEMYSAEESHDFLVKSCTASGNLYNFGGIYAMSTEYLECKSESAKKYGFYFENSLVSGALSCESLGDGEAAFAISQLGEYEAREISFADCAASNVPVGVSISTDTANSITDILIKNCEFTSIKDYTVYTSGDIRSLTLSGNGSDNASNRFDGEIETLDNRGNSWD